MPTLCFHRINNELHFNHLKNEKMQLKTAFGCRYSISMQFKTMKFILIQLTFRFFQFFPMISTHLIYYSMPLLKRKFLGYLNKLSHNF